MNSVSFVIILSFVEIYKQIKHYYLEVEIIRRLRLTNFAIVYNLSP